MFVEVITITRVLYNVRRCACMRACMCMCVYIHTCYVLLVVALFDE